MKKEQSFNIGDKVFAKVKGYPPWPAIVIEENGKKYKVRFYGTGEVGEIKADGLCYYTKSKPKLYKPSKRKDFNDSIAEIEEAIELAGTDGDPGFGNLTLNDSVVSNTLNDSTNDTKKRKRGESFGKSRVKKEKLSLSENKNQSLINDENHSILEDVESNEKEEIVSTIETNKVQSISPQEELTEKLSIQDTEINSSTDIDSEHFILEKELEAFITYADHVEKHKEIYLKMPVEDRNDSKLQILPFEFEKRCIGIKIHKEWPLKSFENEYERAIYDKEILQNALNLKKSFKLDKLNDSNEIYCENVQFTEEDLSKMYKEKLLSIKEDIIKRLKIESSLLEIDSKIKSSLHIDKAEPKEAIKLLDEMLKLNINKIILKKHSHIVDVIRRLRKYIGNMESWNLTEDEKKTFRKDAEEVRKAALKIYVKFMQIIGKTSASETFWDSFNNIVTVFREETKDLSEVEFYMLCYEPYSRKNFIYDHFMKEMPLNVPLQNNMSKEDIA